MDKKNIYLFYSKKDNSTYCIKKFNLDLFEWSPHEEIVPINIALSTSLFINNKSTALVCYSTSINKTIQIYIKYKNLYVENSNWSKETQISSDNTNATHPTIINKDNCTYIMWEEGNNIVYRKSINGEDNWDEKKTLMFKDNNLLNSIYISNNLNDKTFKSPLTLMVIDDPPYPVIDLENGVKKYNNTNNKNKANFLSNEKKISVPKTSISYGYTPKPSSLDFTKKLQELLIIKTKTISELERTNSKLKKQFNNLQINQKENKNDSPNIKIENPDEKNKIIENLNVTLSSLYEENARKTEEIKYLNDLANTKIQNSDEKNKIIENLNVILSSLYQENVIKIEEIKYLKEKNNKKTFFNFFKAKESDN